MDAFKNKTVLVTGGAGAIGSTLVKELLKHSAKVIVLDDLSSGYEDLLPKDENLLFIKGSVAVDEDLIRVFANDVHIVYHLAAFFANENSIHFPERDLEVNGRGTLKILNYAKNANVERFVYVSSSCVYGVAPGLDENSLELNPETPYAITKLLGEYYVNFFHKYYKLNTSILRVFNSYGPGEKPGKYRNVIPNFFQKAIRGEALTVYGTGNETRDFNWIGNLIQLMTLCVTKKEAIGQTFNAGSGKETTIIELAKMINDITGNKAGIAHLPMRDWDSIKRRYANIEKAKKLLGYSPDTENMHEKLKITYDWIKHQI